jgi:hypothetical protein
MVRCHDSAVTPASIKNIEIVLNAPKWLRPNEAIDTHRRVRTKFPVIRNNVSGWLSRRNTNTGHAKNTAAKINTTHAASRALRIRINA